LISLEDFDVDLFEFFALREPLTLNNKKDKLIPIFSWLIGYKSQLTCWIREKMVICCNNWGLSEEGTSKSPFGSTQKLKNKEFLSKFNWNISICKQIFSKLFNWKQLS